MSDYKFTVSHNRHRMDVPKITGWVLGSYWGGWLTPERFQRALSNSTIFGVFVVEAMGEPEQQVGFARVVSDSSANSMITDVYVDAQWRGRGAGTRLMQYVVEHGSVSRTICILGCKPQNVAFYRRFAFLPINPGETDKVVMQRDPDTVKRK